MTNNNPVVGLLHPGAMGASVGAAAVGAGYDVLWWETGRSEATRKRAERAALRGVSTLDELTAESGIVLSVCLPHAASDVAEQVAATGFDGCYVEANAVSPEVARRIDGIVGEAGARVVDGGIIGGPAWQAGANTRLYLSGEGASDIAAMFEGSPLTAIPVPGEVGAASALKMVFAAYTKGTTALLTAILAVAEREGVREALEGQWGQRFTAETHGRVTGNTAKAWRFAGEMQEIAATFRGAGLPGGFHEAAAKVFEALVEFKDGREAPPLEAVLAALIGKS